MTRFAANASSSESNMRRAGLFAASEAASVLGKSKTKSVVIFSAGKEPEHAAEVAKGAAESLPGRTIIALSGLGTIDSTGESARGRDPLTTALALDAVCVPQFGSQENEDAGEIGVALAHRYKRPYLFFLREPADEPLWHSEQATEAFAKSVKGAPVIGAGLPADGSIAVFCDGKLQTGSQLGVRIDGGLRMSIGATAGLTPITELMTIDGVSDGVVTSLGGNDPLPVLERAVFSLNREVVVLCSVLRHSSGAKYPSIMNIQGVEPPRSIRLDPSIRVGDELAFAIMDGAAAESDLEATLKAAEAELRGGVPVAGLAFDCDLRNRPVYGQPGLHAALVADRFPDLPFAGMRTSFEIATEPEHPVLRSFSGVFGLLFKPS